VVKISLECHWSGTHGSENRCKDHHALNWVLVKFGVFDKVIWCRLPLSHSHDFVDRVFSAIEAWLEDNTYDGCFHLFALREFLLKKFASSDSEYKNLDVAIDILMANFDFNAWFHGHVDEKNLVIPEETREDGSKRRPALGPWKVLFL